MCAKQWREIWCWWLTFSSCSSSPLLKFFSSSAFLMRTVPYVELCDEQFENFSKHESLAMYSGHQVCDHHRKKVKFTFPLTEKKKKNCPTVLTQLTLVSVFIESSGHENATILASLSALTSPSTSRLNTIPETTSELWIPEPFNTQIRKGNHNPTAWRSWLVVPKITFTNCSEISLQNVTYYCPESSSSHVTVTVPQDLKCKWFPVSWGPSN